MLCRPGGKSPGLGSVRRTLCDGPQDAARTLTVTRSGEAARACDAVVPVRVGQRNSGHGHAFEQIDVGSHDVLPLLSVGHVAP